MKFNVDKILNGLGHELVHVGGLDFYDKVEGEKWHRTFERILKARNLY